MIKLVMCVSRCPEMSRGEFQDYWRNHHGPLFQKFAETYKARRYVQSHTIDTSLNETVRKSRGMSQEYDGIAEIWWESEKDFIDAIRSPEGQKLRSVFLDDEAKFMDFTKSAAFFTEEHRLCRRSGPLLDSLETTCPQKTRLLFISKSWRSPCSSPVFASPSAFRNCWPRGFSSSVALGARSARSKLLPRCMPSRQSTALLQSSRSNFWPLKPRSSHIVRVATANHQCSRYAVPAASVLPATGELSDADIVRMVKESRS